MKSGDEMLKQIVDKSAVDAAFRQQLLADPKTAITAELGITMPESMNVVVHESDMQTVHLALPPIRISPRNNSKRFGRPLLLLVSLPDNRIAYQNFTNPRPSQGRGFFICLLQADRKPLRKVS